MRIVAGPILIALGLVTLVALLFVGAGVVDPPWLLAPVIPLVLLGAWIRRHDRRVAREGRGRPPTGAVSVAALIGLFVVVSLVVLGQIPVTAEGLTYIGVVLGGAAAGGAAVQRRAGQRRSSGTDVRK